MYERWIDTKAGTYLYIKVDDLLDNHRAGRPFWRLLLHIISTGQAMSRYHQATTLSFDWTVTSSTLLIYFEGQMEGIVGMVEKCNN